MKKKLVSFGAFSFDSESGELFPRNTQSGGPTRLRPQAAQVLSHLLAAKGDLVSRDEIQRAVWHDTTVEFDQGLNACIKEIRAALNDDASGPQYIETLPRRGYRIIVPVLPSDSIESRRHTNIRYAVAGVIAMVVLAIGVRALSSADSSRSIVAVLPFSDLSPQAEYAHLTAGFSEDLIHALGVLDPAGLGVIARTSTAPYATSDLSVAEIAETLGADFVLEGSVRPTVYGRQLSVRLIRASDQTQLWSQTHDDRGNDWSSIKRQLTEQVASSLSLTPTARSLSGGGEAPDSLVRDQLFRARYLMNQHTMEATRRAVPFLERALSQDTTWAPSLAILAEAKFRLGETGEASRLLDKAIAFDSTLVDAHLTAARQALFGTFDWQTAEAHFRAALDFGPGRTDVGTTYAYLLSVTGRHGEAISAVQASLRLDPVAPNVNGDVGWIYYYAGRFDDAARQCGEMQQLQPRSSFAALCLLLAHSASGQWNAARDQVVLLATLGDAPSALLRRLQAEPSPNAVLAYWQWRVDAVEATDAPSSRARVERARGLMALNRPDAALAELTEAAAGGPSSALMYLSVDQTFAPLRGRPEFREIIEMMRL